MARTPNFDTVTTDDQATGALAAANFSSVTDLAHEGRVWTASATAPDGTVYKVTVHGRNGAITIDDEAEAEARDLHADVLKLLDAYAAVRATSTSPADILAAITTALNNLTWHHDDMIEAAPVSPEAEPVPEPVPEPMPVAGGYQQGEPAPAA